MTKNTLSNKKHFVPVYLRTEGIPFFIECGRINYEQVGEYITKITKSISETSFSLRFLTGFIP